MLPIPYLRQLLGSLLSRKRGTVKTSFLLPAPGLERDVMVDVYRPAVPPWRLLSLVVFNDGQDLDRMNLRDQLDEHFTAGTLNPTLVVGLHAGDRMREYGTAGRPDYQGRGDRAGAYEQFLFNRLIPFIERRYNVRHTPAYRAVAGFSLGGLNAFDLGWRHPGEFGVVGVFSGALWWRSKPFRADKPDANRIIHDYVRRAKRVPANRWWFMAGTEDETEDRNNNGIIDAIDDTLQLMDLLTDKGKEEGKDFVYVEVPGGRHEPETWGKVVMEFLYWFQGRY